MIDWWGPVIYEYYAGSEGNGFTQLNSEEWLAHKGSVGTALSGILHICDEDGSELPMASPARFILKVRLKRRFLNITMTPRKPRTAAIRCIQIGQHWAMSGGFDADGYLYLTDRKAFMIISAG